MACGVSRMAAPRMIELNGLNDLMTTADQTNLLLVFSIKRFDRPAQPPDARQSGQCLADRSLPDPRETTRTQFCLAPGGSLVEVTWVPIIGLMGGALGSSEGGAVFPGGPYKRVLEVSNIIIRNFGRPNLYGSPEDPFF